MDIGLVRKVDIDQEMQQSYLDYAMSVIVARALPDARDGLKPVQRRILYAMYDMGLRSEAVYRKSARIVGEVLGKYHPHGDVAVYESMARLAQDFTMRDPLVDGQGNFGSVDGDPPAAMRYTEARLTPFAMELLNQIEKNTVNFTQNFDGTLFEPDVLPSAAPNLLINGANGIAVGMATNIPPHNLGEVIDALVYMLHGWEKLDDLAVQDLMRFIKGPDFPTGGIILQENEQNDLLTAYATGRGRVTVRGRMQVEEMSRGRMRILITELPYLTNKSSLIERIAELVREGDLEGISDLRDESDRHGMRIVVELKQGIEAEGVLRDLYKRTPLQSTFGINMLALVNGEPHLLTLKHALRVYIEHRLEVIRRRSEFDLAKAQQRAHILDGLRIALKNLDEIIALIRNSPDVEQARDRLMKRFKLTEVQAQAILDMPLRRLAALERKKIELEYKDLAVLIKELESLLLSPKRQREVVETELLALKQTYMDRRRTQIVSLGVGEFSHLLLTTNDLTPAQEVWVGVMEDGHIARTVADELPRVAGRSAPRWLLKTNTHHTLYLVSDQGKAAAVSVDAIPVAEKFFEGVLISKVSPFDEEEPLAVVFSLPPRDEISGDWYVVTVTRYGMVKKSAINDLPGPSSQMFTLVKVNPGDFLGWVTLTDGEADLLLITKAGMAIRFSEQEVRPMGLVAAGVNGIKLAERDEVVGFEKATRENELLLLGANGTAWRVAINEYPVQGRYGQGVIACKLAKGVKLVGGMSGKRTQAGTIHFEKAASLSTRLDVIPLGKRATVGKPAIEVKAGDSIIELTVPMDGVALWSKQADKVARVDKTGKDDKVEKTDTAITAIKTKKVDKSRKIVPALKTESGGKARKPAKAVKTGKPRATKKSGAEEKSKKVIPIGKASPAVKTSKVTRTGKKDTNTQTGTPRIGVTDGNAGAIGKADTTGKTGSTDKPVTVPNPRVKKK
jgi:DNA gyrase subunit A